MSLYKIQQIGKGVEEGEEIDKDIKRHCKYVIFNESDNISIEILSLF